MANDDVLAYKNWRTNADLIADVWRLWGGEPGDHLLDATYGLGKWWEKIRIQRAGTFQHGGFVLPDDVDLWSNDADESTPAWHNFDFRDLPADWYDRFEIVAYDPPYKLNGRPSDSDKRYGCGDMTTVKDRMDLILAGYDGCRKVCQPGGLLWVKVMDQVVSGNVVWQTTAITTKAREYGDRVVDRFDMVRTPRPQQGQQIHARRNGSTLLIVQKAC